MVGITFGLLILLGLSYVLVRWSVLRASSFRSLIRATFVTWACAFLLVLVGGFAYAEAQLVGLSNQRSFVDSIAAIKEAEAGAEYVLVEGVVSAENPTITGRDYVADDATLPELEINLSDGGIVVEGLIYQPRNWQVDDNERLFLSAGDEVVVFGWPTVTEREVVISADFIFLGDRQAYVTVLGPSLQRNTTYAQIVTAIGLIAATVVALTPLYRALQLGRERRELK